MLANKLPLCTQRLVRKPVADRPVAQRAVRTFATSSSAQPLPDRPSTSGREGVSDSSTPSTAPPAQTDPSECPTEEEFNEPVPWTLETVVKAFVLWLIPSMLLGSYLMPAGMDFLTPLTEGNIPTLRVQALLHFVLDTAELGITVGVLWICLRQYEPWRRRVLPLSLKGEWLWQVLCGSLFFPLIDLLAYGIEQLSPGDADTWSALGSSLGARDPIANLLYLAVVSLLAPIWEEVMFRGFLLPSLSKYLSTGGAILTSALFFALAHFSVQRFLPILALGVVMGHAYMKSRNLLSSIALHALWNLCILIQLSSGVRYF